MSQGGLYVVSTPIGHLGDFSFRGVETLKQAAVIACEDTRHTRRLLAHYGVDVPLVSLHAYSDEADIARLLDRVEKGDSVAYVTDAGTPAVSDPGGRLVEGAHQRGLSVIPVPGASAVLAALAGSGFPADKFVFLGFPPRKGTARTEWLQRVAAETLTTVCYEAPGRTVRLLGDLAHACGVERPAALARELTKIHEEIRRGTLGELATYYEMNPPRGEITVVVGGRESHGPAAETVVHDTEALIAELAGTGSPSAVAKELAKRLGISKQDAYRLLTR